MPWGDRAWVTLLLPPLPPAPARLLLLLLLRRCCWLRLLLRSCPCLRDDDDADADAGTVVGVRMLWLIDPGAAVSRRCFLSLVSLRLSFRLLVLELVLGSR